MTHKKKVALLGATGSIGCQAIDVLRRQSQDYEIVLLSARQNIPMLVEQATLCQPKHLVITDPNANAKLAQETSNPSYQLHSGTESLCELLRNEMLDIIIIGIAGSAGLKPLLASIQKNRRILTANKEALIMLHASLYSKLSSVNAELISIDSEPMAIMHCLPSVDLMHYPLITPEMGIRTITLTASGGPFLHTPLAELDQVTPQEALKHPCWSMGAKISIDSATMINKCLEVFEACLLFGLKPSSVKIAIHPTSQIHGMVHYQDGTTLMQMSPTDMRYVIQSALVYPKRFPAAFDENDTPQMSLDFQVADPARFPALNLIEPVFQAGQAGLIVFNAADENAVKAFLNQSIRFTDIIPIIEETLANTKTEALDSPEAILALHDLASSVAQKQIKRRSC